MRNYALLHTDSDSNPIYIRKNAVLAVYERYGYTVLSLDNHEKAAVREGVIDVMKLLESGADIETDAEPEEDDDKPIEIMDESNEEWEGHQGVVMVGGDMLEDTTPIPVRDDNGYTKSPREIDYSTEVRLLKKWGKNLPDRDVRMATMRYGLDGDGARTFEDIGKAYGIGRERVRQIVLRCVRRAIWMESNEQRKRKEDEEKAAITEDIKDATWDDIPVNVLNFSVRTSNCLKNSGVRTIAQLAMKEEDDIWRIRNIGKRSIAEIKDKLRECGLRLSMADEEVRQTPVVYLDGMRD